MKNKLVDVEDCVAQDIWYECPRLGQKVESEKIDRMVTS